MIKKDKNWLEFEECLRRLEEPHLRVHRNPGMPDTLVQVASASGFITMTGAEMEQEPAGRDDLVWAKLHRMYEDIQLIVERRLARLAELR